MRALCIAALLLVAVPARAQEDDPAALLQRGVALREAGDPHAAVPLLERALRAGGDERTAYNLAAALGDAGRHAEACRILRRLASAGSDLLLRDAVVARLAEEEREVATLEITVAAGPRVARVLVDGADVRAGRDVLVDPGEHRVEARGEGGVVLARREIVAMRGERHEVELEPVAVPADRAEPLAPSTPAVEVVSRAPASPATGPDPLVLGLGIGGAVLGTVVIAVLVGVAVGSASAGAPPGDLPPIHVGALR